MRFYVFLSSCQKASETVIFFEYAKHPFHLNRSVHTEKCSFLTRQSFQYLGTVFIQYLIHSYRSIPILGTMTFSPMRASAALVIAVISRGYNIAVFGSLFTFSSEFQLSSIGADIFVLFGIVSRVFHSIGICLIRFFLLIS